ncbi:hypothetical protein AALM99_08675 [Lactococcus muris]|uniref:Uncharacterized protein n=1 Tax=Lactococcus muris TaxID=2941330 RepID=A0ABV4DC30_9LACT|nr:MULTISPECIES: hypothetical protein [Lactococcus]HAP15176.1 hypothetical protein [Lactococcus sp.]
MEKVRSFKLRNNGGFVARLHVFKLLDGTWKNITPPSVRRDITLGAERTIDLQNIPELSPGEKVKLKAEVVLGKNRVANEEFIYDPAGPTVVYEIVGTTLSPKLRLSRRN